MSVINEQTAKKFEYVQKKLLGGFNFGLSKCNINSTLLGVQI